MKRNMLRYSFWIVIALVLALIVASGCTRSKSSGPSEVTDESGEATATAPAGVEPSPTTELSGQEAIDATATAWAVETATAAAPTAEPVATQTSEATQAPEATKAPEPTEAAEPTEPPAPTQPPTSGGEQVHMVKPGENLFRISLSYGLPYQTVAAYNGITNPNRIHVGQEIKIPPSGETSPPSQPQPPSGGARYHVVKPGENLFRVALQYNMLYTALAAANNLSYPYTIYAGQKLIIP